MDTPTVRYKLRLRAVVVPVIIPAPVTMTVAKLREQIQRRYNISPAILYLDNAALFDEDILKDVVLRPDVEVISDYRDDVVDVSPSPLPALAADRKLTVSIKSSTGDLRRLVVSESATLSEISTKILQLFGRESDSFCELWSDRVLLFQEDDSDRTTIGALQIRPTTPIFFHIAKLDLRTQRYNQFIALDCLYDDDFWQAPVKQTPLAQSTFLCCLHALRRILTYDSIETYATLYKTLRQRIAFSPAVTALYRLLREDSCINAEKAVVSAALYSYFRSVLPRRVPDNEVFKHSPVVWADILLGVNPADEEADKYREVIS